MIWFKNATIYGIGPKATVTHEQLQAARFIPTTDLQVESSGFSPVRDDLLVFSSHQHLLLNFTIEKKHLPPSAVALLVEEKCAAIEEHEGFLPGKKARKAIKEQAIDELLPRALATRRTVAVWFDLAKHRLVIDTTSKPVADAVLRALIKLDDKLDLQDVVWPRSKVMTEWLKDAPADFSIDDQVSLQYPGQQGKVVKYAKADLHSDDVQQNLKLGAMVDSIAMTFDDRLSFVMTEGMVLRRIRPLDILKESNKEGDADDRFENDFFLMTAEMRALIDALILES